MTDTELETAYRATDYVVEAFSGLGPEGGYQPWS
jgi:hypothetical protein